jgi:hypothetical protein
VARLICSAIASLDDDVADEDGRFDRAAPDEEVHAACRSSWAAGRGRSPFCHPCDRCHSRLAILAALH